MPYVYCWISSCFFTYLAQRSKNKQIIFLCSVIAILIPSILGGLRVDTCGTDVRGYALHDYRAAMNIDSFADFINRNARASHELGWGLVTFISTKIFETFNWNLFMYQIITITCVYIGAYKYRKTSPLWLIMLMFFLTQYNATYNIMRNAMACAVVFMGIDSLEQRRYAKFSIYIAAGALFHSSALICVIYMLLLHMFITSDRILGHNKTLKRLLLYMSLGLLAAARPITSVLVGMVPLLSQYQGFAESTTAGWHGIGWGRALLLVGEVVLFLLYSNGGRRVFVRKWGGGGQVCLSTAGI